MGKIFTSTTETTAARKELIACFNSGTSDTPKWVPIGWHCTDSSLSVDIDTDTASDVLGNSFTNAGAPALSQDFDPLPIRKNTEGDALQQALHDQWLSQDFNKSYDLLIIYLYAGEGTPGQEDCKYDAHRFPASTITPGDFGGSADEPLNRAITINYGGTRQLGTVTIKSTGEITFTAAEGNIILTSSATKASVATVSTAKGK